MIRSQFGDDPRKDSLPCSLRNSHAGHEYDSLGEQFDAIGRKCVAFRVALTRDMLSSRRCGGLF